MTSIIIRRLLQLLPVVLLATTLVFVLVRLAPGDPVQQQLGARGSRDPERVAALRQKLGLDKSIPVQYVIWLRNAVTGDLGISVKSNDQVLDLIKPKLMATLELIVAALGIAITRATARHGCGGPVRNLGRPDSTCLRSYRSRHPVLLAGIDLSSWSLL